MLAEHVEPHDLTGQWMAYHLAELVTAAEDEAATTVDQRIQIVETILRLWRNRGILPGEVPGYELEAVFAALDRLGDDRPWRYVRLPVDPDAAVAQQPLAATAANLERLVRHTVVTLILLAYREAQLSAAEWLEASKALNVDSGDLWSVSKEIDRRLRRLTSLSPNLGWHTEDDATASSRKQSDDDQLSDHSHSRRLREMAVLLNQIAAALEDAT